MLSAIWKIPKKDKRISKIEINELRDLKQKERKKSDTNNSLRTSKAYHIRHTTDKTH